MVKQQNYLNRNNHPRTLHLHIGIPKTATTWLQTKVFPNLDHLDYLDCSKRELFANIDDLSAEQRSFGKLFERSSSIWNSFGDTIIEDLIGNQKKWLQYDRDLLISDEGIGRTGSRPALLSAHFKELKHKANDWSFERVNIICVIRRQDHWIASHYAQMSDLNPKADQDDFKRLVREVTTPHLSRYSFGMLLDYNVLYNEIAEACGEKNLLMLPYEELKASQSTFLHTLLTRMNTPLETIENICSESIGTKANVRSEKDAWQLRRQKRSRFAGITLPNWDLKRDNRTIELTPELTQQIFETYSAGNQKLNQKANLKLDQYGYFGHDLSSKFSKGI